MRPAPGRGMGALFAMILMGCGVAGQPVPPGVRPPAAPTEARVVSVPEGFVVEAARPTRDIDGAPLPSVPALVLFIDDPTCQGVPAVVAEAGPLQWPVRPALPVQVQVAAALGARVGPPSPPLFVAWQAPPPPPPEALVFPDPAGGVQVAWLPPPPDLVATILILRDGQVVARVPAAEARFVDTPPPGRHHYALAIELGDTRSAPSPATVVLVP